MIFCPYCGHKHTAQPLTYRVENEFESFQDNLKEFKTKGEGENTVVTIPSAHIEAGPSNGDRYLMDYDVNALQCPHCNKTFYME